MSDAIQFNSRVGDGSVLNFTINLGQAEAKKEVIVTIEPLENAAQDAAASDWHEFIERTYGSCAGRGLERHDQRQFEQREPAFPNTTT